MPALLRLTLSPLGDNQKGGEDGQDGASGSTLNIANMPAENVCAGGVP